VLGVALLLVVGIGKVLGGGGDAADKGTKATVVSGSPTEVSQPTTPTPTVKPTKKPHKPKKTVPPPLAQPSGPCLDSDVVVTAEVKQAHAGADVAIGLLFTTKTSEACTFLVSPETVVLKLTSGADKIWSSQQCDQAIPTATVIARRTVPGRAALTWTGQRSNDECSKAAGWAQQVTITPKPKIKKPRKNG
jgi:hypothetical protein